MLAVAEVELLPKLSSTQTITLEVARWGGVTSGQGCWCQYGNKVGTRNGQIYKKGKACFGLLPVIMTVYGL